MDKNLNQIKVFYSYSHKDEVLRDALESHLSILMQREIISQWHDRRILAGKEWETEIDNQIEEADIILLLVSSDFIRSKYCYGKELKRAIERHESNQAKVIPIVIRAVDWTDSPFSRLQMLPKDAKAVTSWNNQDEAWVDVVKGIRDAIDEIGKLKERRIEGHGLLRIDELLNTEIDQLKRVVMGDGKNSTSRGVPTGLGDLDNITDGMHDSEFIVVASRPGMGKTDFVLGVAAHVAIKEKAPVAYFSLNLPEGRITRSLISSVAHISSHKLLRGAMADDEWPRLTAAVGIMAESPIYIDDSMSISLPSLKDRLGKLKNEYGLALVIIDSIQHLAYQSKSDRVLSVGTALTKEIKALAKEFHVPILATATISRNVESRINKRPTFMDLDGMRSLEDDADTIIFIYRDEVYDDESSDKGTAEFIIAKNSEGPVGTIRLTYSQEYSRFESFGKTTSDFDKVTNNVRRTEKNTSKKKRS